MQRSTQHNQRLLPRFVLMAMLSAACALTMTSALSAANEEPDDPGIMNGEQAKRILDHGSGGGILILRIDLESEQGRNVKIPVFESRLRMDLILPLQKIEITPTKPKKPVVKRPNRWRSDAFKKWQIRYRR
ncbi:MAG: hypothetical protein MK085_00245 [Phycisphaerales bacterium]|nr:hypothetical protein [Phycisphaerales bacterium]